MLSVRYELNVKAIGGLDGPAPSNVATEQAICQKGPRWGHRPPKDSSLPTANSVLVMGVYRIGHKLPPCYGHRIARPCEAIVPQPSIRVITCLNRIGTDAGVLKIN
jgi:hypothetical protein